MPNKSEWEAAWREDRTGWDLGGVTPALPQWVAAHPVKGMDVLVPGCGRGYDAHYLSKQGANVVGLDLTQDALDAARAAHPKSTVTWRQGDVTNLEDSNRYDLIWEYTCLCALDPPQREAYAATLAQALKPGGVLVGLTFHTVPNPETGPPYQIEPSALETLLRANLDLECFEPDTKRSVKPRQGAEMFFVARKQ